MIVRLLNRFPRLRAAVCELLANVVIEGMLNDIDGQAEHCRRELVEALGALPSTSWDGALICVRVRTQAFHAALAQVHDQ